VLPGNFNARLALRIENVEAQNPILLPGGWRMGGWDGDGGWGMWGWVSPGIYEDLSNRSLQRCERRVVMRIYRRYEMLVVTLIHLPFQF